LDQENVCIKPSIVAVNDDIALLFSHERRQPAICDTAPFLWESSILFIISSGYIFLMMKVNFIIELISIFYLFLQKLWENNIFDRMKTKVYCIDN
jgi:hypothetical protein